MTGELVSVHFRQIKPTKATCKGWEFDWTKPPRNGFDVYALCRDSDNSVQGMIAMRDDPANDAIEIDIVEAAPQNNPHNKENRSGQKMYSGIGELLFAEACRQSGEKDHKGYVYFTAKTNLVEYYQRVLGADLLLPGTRLMAIDIKAAQGLIDRFYGGEL